MSKNSKENLKIIIAYDEGGNKYPFLVDPDDFKRLSNFKWNARFPMPKTCSESYVRKQPLFNALIRGRNRTPGQTIMDVRKEDNVRVKRIDISDPPNFSKSNLKLYFPKDSVRKSNNAVQKKKQEQSPKKKNGYLQTLIDTIGVDYINQIEFDDQHKVKKVLFK